VSSAGSRRTAQAEGEIMKGIKDVGVLIVSTGIAAALLTAFFDWRARLLRQLLGESHEH